MSSQPAAALAAVRTGNGGAELPRTETLRNRVKRRLTPDPAGRSAAGEGLGLLGGGPWLSHFQQKATRAPGIPFIRHSELHWLFSRAREE
jgi:hypothetical protein